MLKRPWTVVGAALFVSLASCSDGAVDRSSSAVRDSAGVRIVESQGPIWADSGPVRIATRKLLEIGTREGELGTGLYRISAVRFLGANRIVLGHSNDEIRVYDLGGNFVRQFGGEGEGPGDFSRLRELDVRADGAIVAADPVLRRLTVFDSLGSVLSTTPIDGPLPQGGGVVGGKWFVGRIAETVLMNGPKVERATDSIVAVNIESGARETWGTTPGNRIAWVQDPNGLSIPLGQALTPVAQVATGRDHVILGSPDRYEIHELDQSGDPARVIRYLRPARATSDSFREPYLEEWRRDGGIEFLRPQFSDSVPHFTGLLRDDRGRVWVQIEAGGYLPDPEWDLFGENGRLLGRVILPTGFAPHEVQGDRIVGVWRDDFDVEYVQVWELEIPTAGEL